PPAHLATALSDESLVSLRQLNDDLVRIGPLRRVLDLFIRGIVPAVRDVVANRSVEQEDVLLDDRQQIAIGSQAKIANVGTVDQNAPACGIVKSGHKIGYRRLPCSA